MGKEKELTRYKADLLEDLKAPTYAALYLNSARDGSPEEVFLALRDIAEAHKISSVAKASNLNRESLYRMLSEAGNPRYASLTAVLKSVGLGILFVPLEPSAGTLPSESVQSSPIELETGTTKARAVDATWNLNPRLESENLVGITYIDNPLSLSPVRANRNPGDWNFNSTSTLMRATSSDPRPSTAIMPSANSHLGLWPTNAAATQPGIEGTR
jgi:probable addiction module antidote protein